MKIQSKANEISQCVMRYNSKSISYDECKAAIGRILAAPYRPHEHGIEHTEEMQLISELAGVNTITQKEAMAQIVMIEAMAMPTGTVILPVIPQIPQSEKDAKLMAKDRKIAEKRERELRAREEADRLRAEQIAAFRSAHIADYNKVKSEREEKMKQEAEWNGEIYTPEDGQTKQVIYIKNESPKQNSGGRIALGIIFMIIGFALILGITFSCEMHLVPV